MSVSESDYSPSSSSYATESESEQEHHQKRRKTKTKRRSAQNKNKNIKKKKKSKKKKSKKNIITVKSHRRHNRKRKKCDDEDNDIVDETEPRKKRMKTHSNSNSHSTADTPSKSLTKDTSSMTITSDTNTEDPTPKLPKKKKVNAIPSILIPNTFFNYERYKNKTRKSPKKVKVGIDIRTYQGQKAGLIQIANILTESKVGFNRKKNKQNWALNKNMDRYISIYGQIYGFDIFRRLIANRVEAIERMKMELGKKGYDDKVQRFVIKMNQAIVQGLVKRDIDKIESIIKSNYDTFYGQGKGLSNEVKSKMYWIEYVPKVLWDKEKKSYLEWAEKTKESDKTSESEGEYLELEVTPPKAELD